MSRATSILIPISILALSLVGCRPEAAEVGAAGNGAPLSTSYENALPPLTQLMVGTFRLEGSDRAVSAEQAAELLPLWKAYRSLSGSDSTSAEELEALTEQLLETMTPEQLEAIAAIKLTAQEMGEVMEERGIEMAAAGARGNIDPEQIETMQAQRASGGVPGGGADGGSGRMNSLGGGFGGGQGANPEQFATLRAERGGLAGNAGAGTAGAGMVTRSPLYNALIELLESKI